MSILRRLRGHRTVVRIQCLDGYARSCCTCGATFKCLDGRFMLFDVQMWERKHNKPDAGQEQRQHCPRFNSPGCWCARDSEEAEAALPASG